MYYYNTAIFLLLVLANGGRHDWAYQWGAFALWLNAIPLLVCMVRQRARFYGLGPLFWMTGVLLPWTAFALLFSYSLFNPNFSMVYDNLFSPLEILNYRENWPTTPNPERSQLYLQFLIGLLIMTAALLVGPCRRQQIRNSLTFVFLLGSAFAAVGCLMKLSGTERFLWAIEFREPTAFATFFYKNWGAYFCLLCAGIGMGLFHRTLRRESRAGHIPEKSIAYAGLVLLLLLSLPVADARGASLLGAPFALAFIFSLTRPHFARHKALGVLVLTAALAFGIWAGYKLVEPQMERFITKSERQLEAKRAGDYEQVQRIALFRDAWTMIKDKPLWGWGIGSFIHIHPLYAGPEFYRGNAELPVAVEFTHSDYLQSLVEMGWAGSFLLFAPFGLLAWSLRKRIYWGLRSLATWTVAGAVAVALTASFDMTLSAPAIAMGVLFCAAAGTRYGLEVGGGETVGGASR